MAEILNSCDGKHSKREKITKELASQERNILEQLASLPPSKHLLKFYQDRLAEFERQDKYLLERISALSLILDQSDRLKTELTAKDLVIDELRSKLLDSKERHLAEKRRSNKASARKENDRSKSREPPLSARDKNSDQQVEYLKEQIVAQELCHKKEVEEEQELRLGLVKEHRKEHYQFQLRLRAEEEVSRRLRGEVQQITNTLIQERNSHRSSERSWLEEKTKLFKKIEFLEKFGNPSLRPGDNTEKRFQGRVAGEKTVKAELNRLKQECQEKEEAVQSIRNAAIASEDERIQLQDRLQKTNKELERLRDHAKKTTNTLNARIEKNEARRRKEVEGYQSDIQMLRREIQRLENTVLSVTSSKNQEKENHKVLANIHTEIVKLSSADKEWKS